MNNQKTVLSKPMCFDCPHRNTRNGVNEPLAVVADTFYVQRDGQRIRLETPHVCHNNGNHTCTGHRLDLRDQLHHGAKPNGDEIRVSYNIEPFVQPSTKVEGYDAIG